MSGIFEGYASVPYGAAYTFNGETFEKTVFAISHVGPPRRLKRRPVAS